MAGDFEISIQKFEVDGRHLVMVGKMGVWDARTYITARELVNVFGKMLSPAVIGFVLKLPILLLTGRGTEESHE